MDGQCVVIVDRQYRIIGVEPDVPPLLVPLLSSRRLPADLELLVRHATSGWRGDIATCQGSEFSYDGDLAVRIFSLLEGDLVRVGLSLQPLT